MIKLKYILMIGLFLGLAGCDNQKVEVKEAVGAQRRCIEGVVYLAYDRGISVMFNKDGTVKTCEVK